ncbi:putative ABC transporter permease [Neobacillus sp. PS3-12]|uniref:putative ABC transporter permease n=1 Tax=Neobacillus sp. PS3-12 TaxID=3070677 RepID=UPI0027DFCBB2|nr:putative ABC transporter permease [Neobacillus sp. PS3-12]WML54487.1 putative ABC transporter permease [Neobacillus sp. PS3-12]
MYGFVPVLLLFFITKQTRGTIVLFLCLFIPTLVEYLAGAMMKKVFHRPYWDYFNIPFQLHGHICLPFSICWVVLSLYV